MLLFFGNEVTISTFLPRLSIFIICNSFRFFMAHFFMFCQLRFICRYFVSLVTSKRLNIYRNRQCLHLNGSTHFILFRSIFSASINPCLPSLRCLVKLVITTLSSFVSFSNIGLSDWKASICLYATVFIFF